MANINKIRISGSTFDIEDKKAARTVTLTQEEYDALVEKDPNVFYVISDSSINYVTSAETQSAITQSVSGKADTSAVTSVSDSLTAHTANTTVHVTAQDKTNWNAKSDFSGNYNDLSNKPTIPTSASQLTNDSGYITSSALDDYTTTATTSALNDVVTAHTANTSIHVSAEQIAAWNAKSDFSGSYNDLTNKLSAGTNVTIVDNVISAEGGGSSYTAGDGIDITNDVISVTGKVDTSTYNTYTAATDTALASKADTATTYTKTEVDNAITAGTSTKQDTLVSGTNIKTINNESILGSGNIDIQGGSTYSGVSGVTINNNNEIYYDGIYKTWLTSNHSNDYAVYWFRGRNAKIWISDSAPTSSYMSFLRPQFSFGGVNTMGNSAGSVAFGQGINISGFYASSFGQYNYSKNQVELSVGQYNTSASASATFGDSGNTLFSVGNGTANNARHNAFEIRQNGDIYLNDGSKLQDTVSATTANTTALGGLKLVKMSQSEYDNLATKDNSTLYVIVN